ncbi:hypothetical protein CPB83DRAFT_790986 [Crepidotus variabilis]|uniref:DUF6535 domain-containing protein n=1 Tax=Crepidotus variabilis TaxID=179855 RepID=A0A9P6EH11_9AGAR|nr:hypothetical protein CPB83DRAFT_790986 [Crepidotus variabilis]
MARPPDPLNDTLLPSKKPSQIKLEEVKSNTSAKIDPPSRAGSPQPASRLFSDFMDSGGPFTSEPDTLSPFDPLEEQDHPVTGLPLGNHFWGGGSRSFHPGIQHRATVPGLGHGRSASHNGGRTRPRRYETKSKFTERRPNPPDGPQGPWRSGEKFRYPLSKNSEDGHWETLHTCRRQYDKERCAAWKEEITQLIIFVALFAAIVVAFLMLSIPKLKDDPNDIHQDLLIHMISQFDIYFSASKNNSLSTANFTAMPPRLPYQPPPSIVRQNGTMLLSTTISLSAVLIGSVCLQWLREYESDTRLGSKEDAALRQMKHDGFSYWRVPLIISLLPVLLQLAVGVFFWGLSEMLWGMNHTITTLNVIIIGLVFSFVLLTTLASAAQTIMVGESGARGAQVPFKSALARFITLIILLVARGTMKFLSTRFEGNQRFERRRVFIRKMFQALTDTSSDNWVAYDMAWQAARTVKLSRIAAQESKDVPRVIEWVAITHIASQRAISAILGAIRELYPSTSMEVLRRLLKRGGIGTGETNARVIERVDRFSREWKLEQIKDDQIAEGVEDVITDLKSALLLDQLVKNNPALRTALLDIRTELFVRILNHNSIHRQCETLNIWKIFDHDGEDSKGSSSWTARLLVPFSKSKKDEDYLLIPDELKAQVISTFRAYLKKREYHALLWDVTLDLILKVVTGQSEASDDLLNELNIIHEDLIAFMKNFAHHDPNRSVPYARLLKYVQDFGNTKYVRAHPPSTSSNYSSPVEADPCAGNSRGLFGPQLAKFEEGMKALKEEVRSPEGLDI